MASFFFNAGKTQLVSFDQLSNSGVIDIKMDKTVLEEKSLFQLLGLSFSSKLDWGSYIISIAKASSKKIGALLHSMKFFSPELVLYLYKSTIRPCLEYCCHVWSDAGKCYLNLLDKLQRCICSAVGPELSASLQSLAHHRDVASLIDIIFILLYYYYIYIILYYIILLLYYFIFFILFL